MLAACVDASEWDEWGVGPYSTAAATEAFWHFWARALLCLGAETSEGGEISGVVRMPEICSPAVSPAVVYLTPVAAKGRTASRFRQGLERLRAGPELPTWRW